MRYKNWEKLVPEEVINDSLWNMTIYRYALFLSDVVWKDVPLLTKNKLLTSSCDQLFRSAGSISANISEGYSRRSKLDQARFYEYALGSARECRGWYFKVRHDLNDKILDSRLKLLTEIIKCYSELSRNKEEVKLMNP